MTNDAAGGPPSALLASADTVVLTSVEDITRVHELKALVLEALDSPFEVVTIDASSVERTDTAALQVLMAFVRDMRRNGRRVEWSGAGEGFLRAARLMGLCGVLGVE